MDDHSTMPHDRPKTILTDAQLQAGRIILSGVICLHVAMLLSLPALAMLGHPIGLVFTGLAMLLKMAWLPILGFGILARLTANREAREAALAASPPDDRPTPMHDTPDAAA